MNFDLQRLDNGLQHGVDLSLEELPAPFTQFYIPPLPEKPQDPIMDTIKLFHKHHVVDANYVPQTLTEHVIPSSESVADRGTEPDIWARAVHAPRTATVRYIVHCH